MASRYFALNRGQQKTDITQGSSTQSKSLEVAVNLADNMEKHEVLEELENIRLYILENIWPPA